MHDLLLVTANTTSEIRNDYSPTNWGSEKTLEPQRACPSVPTLLGCCFLIGEISGVPSNLCAQWFFLLLGPPALTYAPPGLAVPEPCTQSEAFQEGVIF